VKRWAGSSLDDPVGVYIPQDRCLRKIRIYPFGGKKVKTPSLKLLIRRGNEHLFLKKTAQEKSGSCADEERRES
jgi:hypothetical protein